MTCDNRIYKTDQILRSAKRSNLLVTTIGVIFGEELKEVCL